MFLPYKMIFQRALFATSLSFLVFSSVLQAQVYRWVDSNGEVRYTDRPSPESLKVKKADRPQKVELKETAPTSAGSSDHMNASRYYRAPKNNATSFEQRSNSRSVSSSSASAATDKKAQRKQQEANDWFKKHCAYYAKTILVRLTPYDLAIYEQRKKNGYRITKAEKERGKRLDKMTEEIAKTVKAYNEYAASKGMATETTLTMDEIKALYQIKLNQRSRVKSFHLACEDEEGEPYPEYQQYQAYLSYPEMIDPEAMDQFITDNPDIRVE